MEEEEIIKLALQNDEEAKNKIYEKYKYIIDILMRKYHNVATTFNIDKHELEQEALYAFSDALHSFDEQKKVKLSTFITLCVDRRIKKVIKKYSGEKAKLLNSFYSLDYDYEELVKKIEESLSMTELEIFNLLKNDLDRSTIMLLTGKNEKQIDNTIQRLKNKIRDIIKD